MKGQNCVGRFSVRIALLGALAVLGPMLAGCTTDEGTNALVDPATFERSVMIPTLQGLDILPKKEKPPLTATRGPLVMPKQTAVLPPPGKQNPQALPVDNGTVKIETAGLSQDDIRRLRDARVVDLNTLAGRPLTPQEQKQLTARMQMANMAVRTSTSRPLELPPPSYFTNVGGRDTVCKAANGELVAINDPRCPPEIRKALSVRLAPSGSLLQQQDATLTNLHNGTLDNNYNYWNTK